MRPTIPKTNLCREIPSDLRPRVADKVPRKNGNKPQRNGNVP